MAATITQRYKAGALIFLASFLILFLELALIRWIPARVRAVSYFSNLVLLASFLGMGAGCLLVHVRWPLVLVTPIIFFALQAVTYALAGCIITSASPEDQHLWLQYLELPADAPRFSLPAALVIIFTMTSLLFLGLGHAFAQSFRLMAGLSAYSIDILGSLAGTAAFAVLSQLEAPPIVWFILAGAAMAPFLNLRAVRGWAGLAIYAGACSFVLMDTKSAVWSPYHRITTRKDSDALSVFVNSSFHQMAVDMRPEAIARNAGASRLLVKFSIPYEYACPNPRVLILGAGTGNDVQVAAIHGAREITAVEIDPVIARLGQEKNDARPYDNPAVRLIVDDARSFLKKGNEVYDLIVFGTLDSQSLLSGMSALRLENFVYTHECMEQVRRRLAPGGVVANYYSVAKPWILFKLIAIQRQVFGSDPAVIVSQDPLLFNCVVMQGGSPERPFPAANRLPASETPIDAGLVPTDDWPFLYMNRRTIPTDNLWLIAVGAAWSVLLVAVGRIGALQRGFSLPFFFLGAGFMLLEAKGVTEMSLLFGSTWRVNVLVISAVLLMILLANLISLRWKFTRVAPFFVALGACLILRGLVPIESLVQTSGALQTSLAVLRVGAPVFFAGLIFATLFSRATATSVVLGANLVGAMCGGFSESLSLIFGLRALDWLALAFYVAAYITNARRSSADRPPLREAATKQVGGRSAKPATMSTA